MRYLICIGMDRRTRVDVQRETINMVQTRPELKKDTIFIKYKPTSFKNAPPKYKKPVKIIIESSDTLDAVIKYQTLLERRFCFLIMANAHHPGGGWLTGASAQEEAVCRRSNVFLAFDKIQYPLDEFGGIYGRNVKIFRNSEEFGCEPLKKVHTANCIFTAAYSDPPTNSNGVMTYEYTQKTRMKIIAMLDQCIKQGDRNLILSAIGCGAFRNPPKQIAQLFKILLESDKYKYQFDTIVFAIYDSGRAKNYEIFKKIFLKN